MRTPEESIAHGREGRPGSWWVVVNPSSGRGRDVERRVLRALEERDIDAETVVTGRGDEVAGAVRAGVEAGYRRFAVAGGDGTANLVVNGLLAHPWEEPPVLGFLPTGSGCDFIRTFGISQELGRAADHLAGDGVYVSDVGYVEGAWGRRYFLNVAQAGIGAATARRAVSLGFLGARRYTAAFWAVWPGFRRAVVRLDAGRRSYEGPAIMVVFANAQFFGGGMNIAPKANVVDGRLDVQVFTARKHEAFALFPRVRRGLHLTHRSVRRLSVPEASLSTDRPWPVEADGEPLGETPLRAGVVEGAVAIKI